MAEHVIVRQDSDFVTHFWAQDPQDEESEELQPVEEIHRLTPYGMLLAGLGSCTAIVLHTYAHHHDVDLEEVELDLRYDRVFADDCEDCEEIDRYEERIDEVITLSGDFPPELRRRLYAVSKQCPIHKMIVQGIKVHSRLAEEA